MAQRLLAFHPLIMVCAVIGLLLYAAATSKKFPVILGLVQIPAALAITGLLPIVSGMRGARLDLALSRADVLFRSPANSVGELFRLYPTIAGVCTVDYVFWWVPVWAVLLITSKQGEALARFLLAAALALPCYLLFPACGPKFLAAGQLYAAPINAFPSLHFATALLALWFARESRIATSALSAHVALTAMATLGLGEHYFVDLLASLPYAWVIVNIPWTAASWFQVPQRQRLPLPHPSQH